MNIYEAPLENQDEQPIEISYDDYLAYKEDYTRIINLGKKAKKLMENPEFTDLVVGNYFTQEPLRLGSFMASGQMTDSGMMGALDDLKSIAKFRMFMQAYISNMHGAIDALDNLETAYKEASINT